MTSRLYNVEFYMNDHDQCFEEQSGVVPSSPSSFVDHDPTILPLVPSPSTVTRPPVVQVYSRRRENDDTCHAQVLLPDPPENLDPPIKHNSKTWFGSGSSSDVDAEDEETDEEGLKEDEQGIDVQPIYSTLKSKEADVEGYYITGSGSAGFHKLLFLWTVGAWVEQLPDHRSRWYRSVNWSQTSAGRDGGREGASSSCGSQNRTYSLAGRQVSESSLDVVRGALIVCSHCVYALIDPGSTLSYVTQFIAGKRVYRGCTVEIIDRQTSVDLVDLEMVNFDVIMGMDWLASYYANVECRTKIVRFHFPGEAVLEWKGYTAMPKDRGRVKVGTPKDMRRLSTYTINSRAEIKGFEELEDSKGFNSKNLDLGLVDSSIFSCFES
ncbi:hypothetical protein H5410_051228 [Solanum commersonii]|uniref:Gag-pol polyprotein n=1 Tax=Solanum commersonii TaxID=4109 RepID=A0A9J5WXM1_SOLCO|nr:hypothetical protein H5410_051228 [Solanum commersonii]